MILPNKYITMSDSLIGLSAVVIDVLGNKEIALPNLWSEVKIKLNSTTSKSHASYSKFVLAICFMFLAGMINYSESGAIYNENSEIKNI